MKKYFSKFTFYLIIISILIISINALGYDDLNLFLFLSNPLLQIIIKLPYSENILKTDGITYLLLNNKSILNSYLIHIVSYFLYGIILDITWRYFNKLFSSKLKK